MSDVLTTEELELELEAAELEPDERERVRELVGEGGIPSEAIAWVLRERDEPAAESDQGAPIASAEGEPSAKQLKALELELVRHDKRVREVMGAHVAGFEACATCGGVGLMPPGAPAPVAQSHEWFKACDTCAGFGQVLTGSLRAGNEARDCPTCKGRGYLEALNPQGAPLAEQSSTPVPTSPAPVPPSEPAPASENGSGLTYGTPAWMGDPMLGR
jgi:hypothetical protein